MPVHVSTPLLEGIIAKLKTNNTFAYRDPETRFIAALYLFLGDPSYFNTKFSTNTISELPVLNNIKLGMDQYANSAEVSNELLAPHIENAFKVASDLFTALSLQSTSSSPSAREEFARTKKQTLDNLMATFINTGSYARDFKNPDSATKDALLQQLENILTTSAKISQFEMNANIQGFNPAQPQVSMRSAPTRTIGNTDAFDFLKEQKEVKRTAPPVNKDNLAKAAAASEEASAEESKRIQARNAAVAEPSAQDIAELNKRKVVTDALNALRNRNRNAAVAAVENTDTTPQVKNPKRPVAINTSRNIMQQHITDMATAIVTSPFVLNNFSAAQQEILRERVTQISHIASSVDLTDSTYGQPFFEAALEGTVIEFNALPAAEESQILNVVEASLNTETDFSVELAEITELTLQYMPNQSVEHSFTAEPVPTPSSPSLPPDMATPLRAAIDAAKAFLESDEINANETYEADVYTALQNYQNTEMISYDEDLIAEANEVIDEFVARATARNDAEIAAAQAETDRLAAEAAAARRSAIGDDIFNEDIDVSPSPAGDDEEDEAQAARNAALQPLMQYLREHETSIDEIIAEINAENAAENYNNLMIGLADELVPLQELMDEVEAEYHHDPVYQQAAALLSNLNNGQIQLDNLKEENKNAAANAIYQAAIQKLADYLSKFAVDAAAQPNLLKEAATLAAGSNINNQEDMAFGPTKNTLEKHGDEFNQMLNDISRKSNNIIPSEGEAVIIQRGADNFSKIKELIRKLNGLPLKPTPEPEPTPPPTPLSAALQALIGHLSTHEAAIAAAISGADAIDNRSHKNFLNQLTDIGNEIVGLDEVMRKVAPADHNHEAYLHATELLQNLNAANRHLNRLPGPGLNAYQTALKALNDYIVSANIVNGLNDTDSTVTFDDADKDTNIVWLNLQKKELTKLSEAVMNAKLIDNIAPETVTKDMTETTVLQKRITDALTRLNNLKPSTLSDAAYKAALQNLATYINDSKVESDLVKAGKIVTLENPEHGDFLTKLKNHKTKLAELVALVQTAATAAAIPAGKVVSDLLNPTSVQGSVNDEINRLNGLKPAPTPTPTSTTTTAGPRSITMKQQKEYIQGDAPDFAAAEANYGVSRLSAADGLEKTKSYIIAGEKASDTVQMKRAQTLMKALAIKIEQSGTSNKANMQVREKLLKEWNDEILFLQEHLIKRVAVLEHSQKMLLDAKTFGESNLNDAKLKKDFQKQLNAIQKVSPKIDSALTVYKSILQQINKMEINLEATSLTVKNDDPSYQTKVLAQEADDVTATVTTHAKAKADLAAIMGSTATPTPAFSISSRDDDEEKKFDTKDEVAIFKIDGKDNFNNVNVTRRAKGKPLNLMTQSAQDFDTVAIHHQANLNTVYSMGMFNPATEKPQKFTLEVHHLREDLDPASMMAKYLLDEHKGMEVISDNVRRSATFDQLRQSFATLSEKPPSRHALENFLVNNLGGLLQGPNSPDVKANAATVAEGMHKEIMRVFRNPNNAKLPSTQLLLEAEHMVEAYIAAREKKGLPDATKGRALILKGSNKALIEAAAMYCEAMKLKMKDPTAKSKYDYYTPDHDFKINPKMTKTLFDGIVNMDLKTWWRMGTVRNQLFGAPKDTSHVGADLKNMVNMKNAMTPDPQLQVDTRQMAYMLKSSNDNIKTTTPNIANEIDTEEKKRLGDVDERLGKAVIRPRIR